MELRSRDANEFKILRSALLGIANWVFYAGFSSRNDLQAGVLYGATALDV
jgi:hypothetical protein